MQVVRLNIVSIPRKQPGNGQIQSVGYSPAFSTSTNLHFEGKHFVEHREVMELKARDLHDGKRPATKILPPQSSISLCLNSVCLIADLADRHRQPCCPHLADKTGNMLSKLSYPQELFCLSGLR